MRIRSVQLPAEIEEAGFNEVLQTGAALGSWAILDGFLTPTGAGSPSIYREPLGQARELKVALSGLFGRFQPISICSSRPPFDHAQRRAPSRVVRTDRGDLPDWVACESNRTGLTIAEAKGCHDWAGPHVALERAWKQAGSPVMWPNVPLPGNPAVSLFGLALA